MNSIQKLQLAMKYALEHRPGINGFPFLAECLRKAGVKHNIWSLPSAQSIYIMEQSSVVHQNTSLINDIAEIPLFNKEKLVKAIRSDQAGESTFSEFLNAIWNAGITEYDVDFDNRTVLYSSLSGDTYIESYPAVDISENIF